MALRISELEPVLREPLILSLVSVGQLDHRLNVRVGIRQRPVLHIAQVDVEARVGHPRLIEQWVHLVVHLARVAVVLSELEVKSLEPVFTQVGELNLPLEHVRNFGQITRSAEADLLEARSIRPSEQIAHELVEVRLRDRGRGELDDPLVRVGHVIRLSGDVILTVIERTTGAHATLFPLLQEPVTAASESTTNRLPGVLINRSRLCPLTVERGPLNLRQVSDTVSLRHILVRTSLVVLERLFERGTSQLERSFLDLGVVLDLRWEDLTTATRARTLGVCRRLQQHVLADVRRSTVQDRARGRADKHELNPLTRTGSAGGRDATKEVRSA